MLTDIEQQVYAFMTAQLGDQCDVVISNVNRVGTGRSRENWCFDASWTANEKRISEQLIARRDPLGGLLQTDRATEFAVLRALENTTVPAPRPRWLDPTGETLGRPCLVMVREPGACDYRVLGGDTPEAERVGLARRLCELLANVHSVDWEASGLGSCLVDPGNGAAAGALAQWEAVLRRDQIEPYPELELAADRLRRTSPPSPRTVLVHGDFKPGNVLLLREVDAPAPALRIVALLDWELAHLGDPLEDLGWVTQPLRTREHFVAGVWGREELLSHYEKCMGVAVDRRAVAWWNTFSSFKTAVMQVSGLRSFVEGRSDEPYQPSAAVLHSLLDAVLEPAATS